MPALATCTRGHRRQLRPGRPANDQERRPAAEFRATLRRLLAGAGGRTSVPRRRRRTGPRPQRRGGVRARHVAPQHLPRPDHRRRTRRRRSGPAARPGRNSPSSPPLPFCGPTVACRCCSSSFGRHRRSRSPGTGDSVQSRPRTWPCRSSWPQGRRRPISHRAADLVAWTSGRNSRTLYGGRPSCTRRRTLRRSARCVGWRRRSPPR